MPDLTNEECMRRVRLAIDRQTDGDDACHFGEPGHIEIVQAVDRDSGELTVVARATLRKTQ